VTVEGVETDEQRDLVVAMGCTELQGFLLSAPLSETEMRAVASGEQPALPHNSAAV
jgi:EAL domain-containing protein (putative c-di-GMP-specific phosphodiesterase class I)